MHWEKMCCRIYKKMLQKAIAKMQFTYNYFYEQYVFIENKNT